MIAGPKFESILRVTRRAEFTQSWITTVFTSPEPCRNGLPGHPRVKLYFLPCCKPQLNPVEKIWWLLKAVVTANRLYGLMDALADAVSAFLENLTPSEIQILAA
jgi:transposase